MKKQQALFFIKAGFADNQNVVNHIKRVLQIPESTCRNLNINLKPNFDIIEESEVYYTRELAEKHYAELSSKPFFGELVDYMSSGKMQAFIIEGDKNTIEILRTMLGATRNPARGTLRHDIPRIYGFDPQDVTRNTAHCSDSEESAKREIAIYKKALELQNEATENE